MMNNPDQGVRQLKKNVYTLQIWGLIGSPTISGAIFLNMPIVSYSYQNY